jgi:hypothetical protein
LVDGGPLVVDPGAEQAPVVGDELLVLMRGNAALMVATRWASNWGLSM